MVELGMDPSFLTGKHGPCPVCVGGKDRFRFDDKEGRGTFICGACGAGDGFDLICRYNGWDFQTAANAIDKLRGKDIQKEVFKEPVNYQQRRQNLNKLWGLAKSPAVLRHYMVEERGLNAEVINNLGGDIRGHEAMDLYEDGKMVGRFPGVVCLVRDLAGNPISAHRTYMLGDGAGKAKKLMPGMAQLGGTSIRLIHDLRSLVVGEGIETTLAGWQYLHTHVPDHEFSGTLGAWAGISAHGLKEMLLPETLETLWICMDADFSFTGQAAAYELARKVKLTGRTVKILEPTMMGCDLDDVLEQGEVRII